MSETRSDWSNTVRLPKTDFPMKGDLAKREPEMLQIWSKGHLYERLMEHQKGRPAFILHDGPPYANGNTHIGHALNKILKDVTVKAQSLMGKATAYVPGWDCHGLPIETALLKEMKMSKRAVTDIPKFRQAAADFAERFIAIQREEFMRLGVIGDWYKPYKTMDKTYESNILRAFRLLVKNNHVYRGLKPVLWCPTCETALAEAEVEYKDKVSPSIYVALPIVASKIEDLKPKSGKSCELVVWTTTPWTLPANQAVAVHPLLEYVLVHAQLPNGSRSLVIAKSRLEPVLEALSVKESRVIKSWTGLELSEGLTYARPYAKDLQQMARCVVADYVSAEDGSGLVHTAPGHGEDDFNTGQREKLEIYNPVDGSGLYDNTVAQFLRGKHILKEANELILEDLKNRNFLLLKKDITHSYPHCWRCKNPVIFRTTEQWFLRLSTALRDLLLNQIDGTSWIPPEGRTRIAAMVTNRPDWCLSRQRVWGTPITVLYGAKSNKPILDDAVLEAFEKKSLEEGTNFWFERWGEVLTRKDWPFLPDIPALKDGFRRESDILDVWLDSGVSWLSVLGQKVIADLYIEGSDQHRGWFQSSLVMSTALRGHAPYKAVLTHGFVLDEKGRAMHKSAGNVVAPQEVIKKWGADVLRLWVALSDFHEDVRISDKLLEGPADSYRRVRNTLRYLLGNLSDFDEKKSVPFEELPEMERFVLHRLAILQKETLNDYQAYRYRAAARRLVDFCAFDLSAFYLDVTKDRLYTFRLDSKQRLAAQTVMAIVLKRLCSLWSPILTFTAEEAWRYNPHRKTESIYFEDLPTVDPKWTDLILAARWEKALTVRAAVQKALEETRTAKKIGSSLQACVNLRLSPEDQKAILGINLAELLIVSEVQVDETKGETSVSISTASGSKCPRCWRWQSDIGRDSSFSELCARCAQQLS